MIWECPRCKLVSPPEAQRCDCGYDFASRTQQRSYLRPLASGNGGPLPDLAFGGLGLVLFSWLMFLAAQTFGSADKANHFGPQRDGFDLWAFLTGIVGLPVALVGMFFGAVALVPLARRGPWKGAWAAGVAVVLGLAAVILIVLAKRH